MVVVQRIRFGKRNLGMLSPLEDDVLRVLWRNDSGMRVRDVHNSVRRRRKVALTSVAVILDRLHDKKIVKRRIMTGRGGEHYVYSCCAGQSEFQKSVVEKTVDKLIDNFGPVAVSYFNERFANGGNRKRKARAA
jgi:predicted transcriptional regulator